MSIDTQTAASPQLAKPETDVSVLPMQSMSNEQLELNRRARERALRCVSPAINLAAPGVDYHSDGRLLLLGAEHQIRLAADRLGEALPLAGLVTEAMPEQVDSQMEQAAELSSSLELYSARLAGIQGYLGAFDVQVELDGQSHNLAKLAFGCDTIDLILDLSTEPFLASPLKPAGYFAPRDAMELADALAQLPAMKGVFEKPRYFQIDNDRCAHQASGLTGCTRCLDVCPADALRVLDGNIKIDAHLCHGAGGCATACPTSAIRYGFPQPVMLLDSLQRLLSQYHDDGGQRPHLLLHDPRLTENGLPELLEVLPGNYLPLQIEEIGSAGLEVWLSAVALGAVGVSMLIDDRLPDQVRSALEHEIDTANRMLQGLVFPARIALVDTQRLMSQSQADSPLSGVTAMAKLATGADKREQVSLALTHLYQQQLVRQSLPRSIEMGCGASFGEVTLNTNACTLCMSCSSICPTGALQSAADTPQLSFTEDACVQCGLCKQACPESALDLQPRLLLDPAERTQPRVLKKEEPFCCISCGVPFATQSLVSLMITKLTGHSMFEEGGLRRLKMCQDCRVIDIVKSDPGEALFEYAKGREQQTDELNLATEVKS